MALACPVTKVIISRVQGRLRVLVAKLASSRSNNLQHLAPFAIPTAFLNQQATPAYATGDLSRNRALVFAGPVPPENIDQMSAQKLLAPNAHGTLHLQLEVQNAPAIRDIAVVGA